MAELADGKIFSPPQPDGSTTFRYVRAENIKSCLFQGNDLFAPGSLVWVCKSKGLRKKKRKKPSDETAKDDQEVATKSADDNDDDGLPAHRMELFLRARVVKPEEDRIRVQYSKGATYGCQVCNLIPVLETNKALVLVAAETSHYRRCCVVHTLPGENFMEIGCDYGQTPDRIHRTGTEEDHRLIWGVDKSTESISIARRRYPAIPFFECDVLESAKSSWPEELQEAEPAVIAVDINGNRELEAVCIEINSNHSSYQPRLIIVKSRELHAKLT